MMENTTVTVNELLEGTTTMEAEVNVTEHTETIETSEMSETLEIADEKKTQGAVDENVVDEDTAEEEVVDENTVEEDVVEEGTEDTLEEDEDEDTEDVVEKENKLVKVLSEKVYPDNLKEVLHYEQYEERTQRIISKLDDAGLALLSTGVNMGYTVDANNTYIGLKNSQDKLVARVYTIKKGNRLYTFEKKLESILKEYTNGEITCMGKPGVGNTNTFITLSLLNEAQREQILATLDPSN